MPQPIGPQDLSKLLDTPGLGQMQSPAASKPADGAGFKDALLESLEEVSRLQKEAALGVGKLQTGESNNVVEVFAAIRKADIAFSMLMEIRNKLTEAYRELQQTRI